MPLPQKFKTMSISVLILLVFCIPSQSKKLNSQPTATILRRQNDVETSMSSRGMQTEVRGTERMGLDLLHWNVKDLITYFDGVPVWSDFSESLMPEGFSDRHVHQWQEESRRLLIKEVRQAVCGRNALVILEDGRTCCSRY